MSYNLRRAGENMTSQQAVVPIISGLEEETKEGIKKVKVSAPDKVDDACCDTQNTFWRFCF